MGKNKKIKANEVLSVPKQTHIILAEYKPMPRFRSGCKFC